MRRGGPVVRAAVHSRPCPPPRELLGQADWPPFHLPPVQSLDLISHITKGLDGFHCYRKRANLMAGTEDVEAFHFSKTQVL